MNYSQITDISIVNSLFKTKDELLTLYNDGFLSNSDKWGSLNYSQKIADITKNIQSPIKKRMSQMSCGIFYVMEEGAGKTLKDNEEIYLFTAFGEIDTTNEIISSIVIDNMSLVSPTHFHNSVHNTPLGYYTIIKKLHNYCGTISDGIMTDSSFVNFVKNRVKLSDSFVVTSGEEYSPFLDMDVVAPKKIAPSFISYRITPQSDNGFRYLGVFKGIEEIVKLKEFNDVNYLFCDKELFLKLQNNNYNKKIVTEYPIVLDNPCGVIFRLALPFWLSIGSKALVLHSLDSGISLFEVTN